MICRGSSFIVSAGTQLALSPRQEQTLISFSLKKADLEPLAKPAFLFSAYLKRFPVGKAVWPGQPGGAVREKMQIT
ncbi:MAG: hypothetical protein OEV91_09715, partial [Desulfobulbaceae bacterium]|nr:hypothetical protein [Desulfobulbaceae bacterium]